MISPSPLFSANSTFIEGLYRAYLDDSAAIPEAWRHYFDALLEGRSGADEPDHEQIRAELRRSSRPARPDSLLQEPVCLDKQVAVLQLINAYRFLGHVVAKIDPLQLRDDRPVEELDPAYHGLGVADLNSSFAAGSLAEGRCPLDEIVAQLRAIYCDTVGAEYMHITATEQKRWIQARWERPAPPRDAGERRQILERVIAAEVFEQYLHKRYVGQKRFSLEGAESLLPILDALVRRAGGEHQVRDVIIGMAHRGRLNVLVNLMGRAPAELYQEFEGRVGDDNGAGDVKYHRGASVDLAIAGSRNDDPQAAVEPVHVGLAFNPSHLEIVAPVVQGSARARQQRLGDHEGELVIPVLIHGDAAIAGQGVVMESLNMSQARGFKTGGTLHIVLNNQIGFTTSSPMDARSTPYCTEVARMVQAPIFHVNGDDPESAVRVVELLLDFRMRFKKDVVIDLVCYRRHGHNEADEPAVTQPRMYQKIRAKPLVSRCYGEQLQGEEIIEESTLNEMAARYRAALEQGEVVAPNVVTGRSNPLAVNWLPFVGGDLHQGCRTGVPQELLGRLAERLTRIPEGFELHPRVRKVMQERRAMGLGEQPLDWGFAETLAYASLINEGYPVRLTGQDSGRGTFFHRHAVLHDQRSGAQYLPLQQLFAGQPSFTVIDSLLSEEAVLAFEYGFSSAEPNGLVIWEAQFGDFANAAQVVIDQFICSGEAKWGRLSGLVMFLPHGYDGQGPEHSSARLERFLQLCADDNIQVCVPSLPSQWFHMLRRQLLRRVRKPLVIFTPKSLLRHPASSSPLNELAEGELRLVIGEERAGQLDPAKVRRIVLCAGKLYFTLAEARAKRAISDIILLRIEQLYPYPSEAIDLELKRYPQAEEILWAQEEPQNQGAWSYLAPRLLRQIAPHQRLDYAGRPAAASPAVGYLAKHRSQEQEIIERCFGGD